MSSAVLYLAIVALWAVVLVPMWLRRDGDPGRLGLSWFPHRRPEQPEPPAQPEPAQPEPAGHAGSAPRRRGGRGAVIARRRRRTLGLSLLVLACAAAGGTGLAPFWVAAPSVVLFAAHLSLLRVAVSMDAARREAAARIRAAERAATRAAMVAADAAQAEIIDLMERNRARDVFDQYAPEGLRAVGD